MSTIVLKNKLLIKKFLDFLDVKKNNLTGPLTRRAIRKDRNNLLSTRRIAAKYNRQASSIRCLLKQEDQPNEAYMNKWKERMASHIVNKNLVNMDIDKALFQNVVKVIIDSLIE